MITLKQSKHIQKLAYLLVLLVFPLRASDTYIYIVCSKRTFDFQWYELPALMQNHNIQNQNNKYVNTTHSSKLPSIVPQLHTKFGVLFGVTKMKNFHIANKWRPQCFQFLQCFAGGNGYFLFNN